MNEIKSFTIYIEYFKLINTLKPIKKRDEFIGKILDFYFKDVEPIFEKDSDEEAIWENIAKPITKYKTNALNGLKGGAPVGNQNAKKTTENTTQETIKNITESVSQETNTSKTVIVTVNSNMSNVNNLEDKSMREETFKKIQNEFNSIGLSKVTVLSKTRKDKLKLRISEFGENLIIEAIRKIPKSKFLMGDNKQGWKCSFDWLIENDKNILKVYEGNYDSKKKINPVMESYLNEIEKGE